MKRAFISFGIFCASLAALACAEVSHPAAAKDDMSFAGRTVTVTIGFSAGGGVDLYGRMLGRHLARYLPGHPGLIVLNQLGAGGVVALNDWANRAEPNGLFATIGAQSQIDPDLAARREPCLDLRLESGAVERLAFEQDELLVDEPPHHVPQHFYFVGKIKLHRGTRRLSR